ncbi:hypothetical protein GCM10011529_01420 [Polymorphobacter glacialis]|uniref:Uncharacterized protein n=1 Tax=Sandarakinorhabdus glacialis TaxID=1614636 RepID=A0A916ZI28_9SPHN|nr:hypothetical protein GCM10011529_01420 [Polymorphobacter glacialis]
MDGGKNLVEAADAAETGLGGDLRHCQFSGVDEGDGGGEAPGLRDRDGRDAEMALEEAADLAGADAELVAQIFYKACFNRDRSVAAVEGAGVDQCEGAADAGGGAVPGRGARGGFGAATLAGAEIGGDSGGGGFVEGAVLE